MKITERANQRQKIPADLVAAMLVKGLTSKPKQKGLKDIAKVIPRNEKQKILFELKILTVAADLLLMAETLKVEKVKKAIFEAYMGFLMHQSIKIFNIKQEELSLILDQRIQTYEKVWTTSHTRVPFPMIGKAFAQIIGHPDSGISRLMGANWFSGHFIYSALRKINDEYEITLPASTEILARMRK